MTVAELIRELRAYDGNMDVKVEVDGYDHGSVTATYEGGVGFVWIEVAE